MATNRKQARKRLKKMMGSNKISKAWGMFQQKVYTPEELEALKEANKPRRKRG